MKNINRLLCYGFVLALAGCAGAKKAELAGDDPAAAVAEVTAIQQSTLKEQADLLSFKEYNKGSEALQKADKGLTGGYKSEIVLGNAAIAKAHFIEARRLAGVRSVKVSRMLHARESAINAGLRTSDDLVVSLLDVDDDLRGETDNFESGLSPKEFSEFQKEYFSLEVRAVQFRELDSVTRAIQKANRQNADDLAPNSLNAAMLDLNEAQNLIAQSPRNPDIHMPSVKKAIASSVLLSDVMDVILNAKGTPEHIALRIVKQNRELGTLSKNVGQLEQNLKSTQSNLQQTEGVLQKQKEELAKSSTQIRFQHAMEEAGKNFSEDEASVYQQGANLIFRLKKINFASGTSTVPTASMPLLSKVNDIITSIKAEMVVVQGHTDSVGSSALNSNLSTKRASSVATYLASLAGGYKIGYVGYGESRPIASNETKNGRAINRRVDLVVTAKK